MKLRLLIVFCLAILVSQPLRAQYFSFEKIPGWVKIINPPEKPPVSKYDIMTGFYTTLEDYQANLEEDAYFSHEVRNVISYGGITNASQLAVSLDTSYQKLLIHHLFVWRKGNKIDRTKDLSFEIMNNEQNLHQGIYTGQVIVYDILNDIRKDDLIDFAYTTVGKNPIFNNEKYLLIPFVALNPIDLYSIRVVYPKEKEYQYSCVGCDSLVTSSEADGLSQVEIKYENLKAIKFEDNTPLWTMSYKYFTLSSLKSWQEVNNWAQDVFALKNEPVLDEVFSEIFNGKETTDEKLNKIIDYVQDDIRYQGIEAGIGSIKPHSPEVVVKQRFGDCKDKSLLLVSLLKKTGITEAYPALVNTAMQHELVKLGPSNEIFNHCIVTFGYNDTNYWVDPSIPMQGGDFKDLKIVNYGKALVIGLPADTLQTMPERKPDEPDDIVDEYTIDSFTKPAKLKITSRRYGFEADSRRALVEFLSPSKLLEMTMNDLKLQFPSISKASDLEVDDDTEKNIFSVIYNFDIDDFWQDGDKGTIEAAKGLWILRFEPQTLYHELNVSACDERETDFALNYPFKLSYKVIFHLPKALIIDDEYRLYDNEAFFFEEKLEQLSSNTIQIQYNYRTKSNYIKAADYKKICEQKNTIAKRFPLVIYFPK